MDIQKVEKKVRIRKLHFQSQGIKQFKQEKNWKPMHFYYGLCICTARWSHYVDINDKT